MTTDDDGDDDAGPSDDRLLHHAMRPSEILFNKVIAASGLSEAFARGTIQRACARAGVNADAMTPSDLARVIGSIEQALAVSPPVNHDKDD